MTIRLIKAIKVLSIIATVRSQILCQLTVKMICGLKSQHLQTQNATIFKVLAGIKQACRQVLRFEGQNNLLGEKDLFYYSICLKQTFLGTIKFSWHKNI